MATIDTQLAELLGKNAELFAVYEAWSNANVMLLAGTADDPDSFDENGGKTGPLGYYPVVNVSGQTIYIPSIARLRLIAIGGANEETLAAALANVNAVAQQTDATRAAIEAQRDELLAAGPQVAADKVAAEGAKDLALETAENLGFFRATGFAYGKAVRFGRVDDNSLVGDVITEDGYHYAKYAIRVVGTPWSRGADGFYTLDLANMALSRYKFASGGAIDGSTQRYYAGVKVRHATTDSQGRFAWAVLEDGRVVIPKLVSPAIDFANFAYPTLKFASGDKVVSTGALYHRGRAVRRAWADSANAVSIVEYADGTIYIPKLSSPALDLSGGAAALDSATHVFTETVVGGGKQLKRLTKATGRVALMTATGNNFAPRLSADGSKVIYLSDRGGALESWYQRLDGAKLGGAIEHPVEARRTITAVGDSLTAGGYPDLVAPAFGTSLTAPSSSPGGGIGSQTADQIAARFGAAPDLTCTLAGNVMTAGANLITSISIQLLSRASDTAGTVRTLRASILGISGVLISTQQADTSNGALAYTGQGYRYTFTPDAGQTLPGAVPANTALIVDPEDRQDSVLLIWVGRNNVGQAGWQDEVKARIAAIVAAHKPLVPRFLVIGVTNATWEPSGSAAYNQIVALNAELAALYGERFVDVRPAFNAGTADDTPSPSLAADGLHYNGTTGRAAIAAPVTARITALGWYA